MIGVIDGTPFPPLLDPRIFHKSQYLETIDTMYPTVSIFFTLKNVISLFQCTHIILCRDQLLYPPPSKKKNRGQLLYVYVAERERGVHVHTHFKIYKKNQKVNQLDYILLLHLSKSQSFRNFRKYRTYKKLDFIKLLDLLCKIWVARSALS